MGCSARSFVIIAFIIILLILIPTVWKPQCMYCGEAGYNRIWNIAYKDQQYAKVITEFEKFTNKCPEGEWTTYARLHRGECFLELGDEEQARECFEEVVQLNWN